MRIGIASAFQTKAKALYEGLHVAWQKGFRQVEIESDNALLIKVTNNGNAVDNNLSKIRLIHSMMLKDWYLRFRYV